MKASQNSLTQTRSVQDYIAKFQRLDLQTHDESAAQQLDKFTAELKPAMHEKVEIEGCTTLAEPMRNATRINSIRHRHQQQISTASSASAATSSLSPISSDGPSPIDLGAMRQGNA